jgi:hypothetical protein
MLENYANFLVKPDEDILTFDVPDDVLERTDGNSKWASHNAPIRTSADGLVVAPQQARATCSGNTPLLTGHNAPHLGQTLILDAVSNLLGLGGVTLADCRKIKRPLDLHIDASSFHPA